LIFVINLWYTFAVLQAHRLSRHQISVSVK
jgi:hypothetical protein